MQLNTRIPEEVVRTLKAPPSEAEGELSRELSLALYQRGALPLGKARLLAGMNRRDFEELLGQRGVSWHYGEEELEEDVRYARRGG